MKWMIGLRYFANSTSNAAMFPARSSNITSASVRAEKSPLAIAAARSLARSGLRSTALAGRSAGRPWPRTPGWSASVLISSSTPSSAGGCAVSSESAGFGGSVGRSAGLGCVIRGILPAQLLRRRRVCHGIWRGSLPMLSSKQGQTRWAFGPEAGPARAHNSAVECHLHTVEVVGSNPAVPTIPRYSELYGYAALFDTVALSGNDGPLRALAMLATGVS